MKEKELSVAKLDPRMAPLAGPTTPLRWHAPGDAPFRLAGLPWFEQEQVYRRLPVAPRLQIPAPVDALANCTAGAQVAFQSDSSRVAIRVELSRRADMNHMPATGQCGFDLYVGPPGGQRFHSVTKFDHTKPGYELLLFEHSAKAMRSFTLNFPLYVGVKAAHIGLTPEAQVAPPPPWSADGKIVFYGTSITQGGCASRPGMAFTNILSRALNMEVVNLGFSGNGRGEPEMIELMADVPNPKLLVLDYHANSAGKMAETLPVAVRILRDRQASVPVLVVCRIAYARDLTHEDSLRSRENDRDIHANLVADLRRAGDTAVHFLDGTDLLGPDFDECTVDGVHPSDLGFLRMARGLETEIRRIMENNVS